LIEAGQGGAQPNINNRIVRDWQILLAPLAEQKRIVAKVEDLLTQANAARDRLGKVPKILKRFRQSVLAAACSARLTEDWRREHTKIQSAAAEIADTKRELKDVKIRRGVPDTVEVPEELSQTELPSTWVMKSVGELIHFGALLDVKDGNHGANHPKAIDFSEKGLPFITAAQVTNYHIDYAGAPKVIGRPLQRLRVGFAKIGDAVLTHKGTVGRAALNTQVCVLTPQTTYYRCKQGVLNAKYLVYFFTAPQFYQQLAAVMSQTTRDFVPISGQYYLFLFVPPPLEQHEIVRRVEALFKLADAIEKRVEAATKRADKLTQAILGKAFRGELVPTEAALARREGRTYEPASALLERIRM
jgi:type I restriction enzyme S subunit